MKNEQDTFEISYQNELYDIKEFLKNHPGGRNYLAPYRAKEVTKRMEDIKHSKAALYLFKEYKKDDKRKKMPNEGEEEDLEKLVDWSKPMLVQVTSLGTKYKEWVISPVDRHLRLFGNPILENLTITPWYVVPIVWIPVIIYLIKLGAVRYTNITKDPSPWISVVLFVVLGITIWSLLEYSLHRWVFHIEPSGHSKLMIYFHFIIHGLHHKVPFDTRRLVFPPFPAAIIAFILYQILSFVIPESHVILITAGAIAGYVMYDMIHYYLHYGSPEENTYFYQLKRYHNQHHFAHHDSGFGISSIFWDKIFGTAIRLRHLKMGIKW
ncbi:fatty acid 2-hydroxylase [Euwallacea fornicatus]|uniref:fatty acid 2-hydroxylase n=1 Tax=Euwallacea fornicatus TaxID=995702 RepID=UPI00338E7FCB